MCTPAPSCTGPADRQDKGMLIEIHLKNPPKYTHIQAGLAYTTPTQKL
jgi:hypothetical protein